MLIVVAPARDGGLDAAEQEVGLGARRVHRTPLDVVGVAPGAGDAVDHPLVHLLGVELQLVLAMERRGADEGVDAPALRGLQRFRRPVDVAIGGARQAAYDGLLQELGDLVHGREIAVRGDGKAGLDHVDAHGLEDLGDAQLFRHGHRAAGRLLAVAQGGVEDDHALGRRGRRIRVVRISGHRRNSCCW